MRRRVLARRLEFVLRARDRRQDVPKVGQGLIESQIVVEMQVKQVVFEELKLVGLVEEPDGLADVDQVAVFAEQFEPERMERSGPHLASGFGGVARDPLANLSRRFVRERQHQDRRRRNAFPEQVFDPRDQRPGLPGAWSGFHQ